MDPKAVNLPPTPEHCEVLGAQIGPMLAYLGRLRDRLTQVGVPPHDLYMQSVEKAYNAVHELSVRTHYRSCRHGVGR